MSPESEGHEARIVALEHWRQRVDAREYPSELRLIFERLQVASEWQTDQARLMGEVREELRQIAIYTATQGGGKAMRRALVAGSALFITVFVGVIGLALNALGVI